MKFTASLENLRTSFLEGLRVRSFSPATLKYYGGSLDVFFRFLVGRGIEDLREVTRETIRAYQSGLVSQSCQRTGKPWSLWTVHARLIALRRFFEHLEKTDAILINPCVGMILPTLPDRLPRNVLTEKESRAILDAPDTQTKKGIRDKAILELFYSTGIRGEEMAGLTLHDVDTRNGFLRVNKGKFAKDRVVPMGKKASDYVHEYLTKVRLPWSRHQKDERALWLSAILPHGPLKKQAIAVLVKDYKTVAGIERPGRTHLWRHTCATHLVANGANLAYVQRLLGHRSLATTQIYTRVAPVEVQATARRSHPRMKSRALAPTAKPQRIKGSYEH